MRPAFALLLALSIAAAAPPAGEEQRARDAVRDLGQLLKQMLAEEMKRGGLEGAVRMCSENAQVVTDEFAHERGLEIRRVSTRYRNAKDRPDEYEARILAQWARSGKPATHVEQVTENGRVWLRLMEPILLQAMCVNCHGTPEQMPEQVRAVLAERYPRDKATGFKPGELRGGFSVVVPVAPAP
jgi:hypothetical protein